MKPRLLATAALAAALAAPIVGVPVGALAGPPAGNAWRMTFSDDFNGDGLDPSKWTIVSDNYPTMVSARFPENVEVRDGVLRLVTRHEQRGGKQWTTGNVKAKSFQQTYGYFEAKMRYAAGHSLNNAFWLISDRPATKGGNEIDINEGHFPGEVTNNLHAVSHPNLSRRVRLDDDGAGQFHVYGAFWAPPAGGQPAIITWYVDGRPVNSEPCPDCNEPAHLLFSTAILPWMKPPGPELDGTAMEVKWVRAYQLAGPLRARPPRVAASEDAHLPMWQQPGAALASGAGRAPQGPDPFWSQAPSGIPAKLDWLQGRIHDGFQQHDLTRRQARAFQNALNQVRQMNDGLADPSTGVLAEPDRLRVVDRMHKLSLRLDAATSPR